MLSKIRKKVDGERKIKVNEDEVFSLPEQRGKLTVDLFRFLVFFLCGRPIKCLVYLY